MFILFFMFCEQSEQRKKTFLYEVGKKIENLYLEKFSSQNEFAKEVECDARTIRRIIRGEQNISILLLVRISEVLEVDLKELL